MNQHILDDFETFDSSPEAQTLAALEKNHYFSGTTASLSFSGIILGISSLIVFFIFVFSRQSPTASTEFFVVLGFFSIVAVLLAYPILKMFQSRKALKLGQSSDFRQKQTNIFAYIFLLSIVLTLLFGGIGTLICYQTMNTYLIRQMPLDDIPESPIESFNSELEEPVPSETAVVEESSTNETN